VRGCSVGSRRQLGWLACGVWFLWLRLTVASGVAGLAAWAAASYIAAPTSRWLLQAIALIVGGVLFVLAFVVASRLLRIGEVTEVLTRLTSRITGRLGARSAR
jgi:hypothetical protein